MQSCVTMQRISSHGALHKRFQNAGMLYKNQFNKKIQKDIFKWLSLTITHLRKQRRPLSYMDEWTRKRNPEKILKRVEQKINVNVLID